MGNLRAIAPPAERKWTEKRENERNLSFVKSVNRALCASLKWKDI